MTFGELLQQMRSSLVPYNPDFKVVKMNISYNHGYLDAELVVDAINTFEQRASECLALGEKLNPLEHLGAELLIQSAYLLERKKPG